MRCPQCDFENREGRRFCARCGAPLALACAACGFSNEPGEEFCGGCGRALAQLAPPGLAVPAGFASPHAYTPRHLAEKILTARSALEGERKQVTVLFCDLANSTGLAERLGPEPMHTLLDRFFELALAEVHRYEGTINQFLGDGFMGLFGAPLAHEDHARRAVLAALGLQRALRERQADLGPPPGVELALRMGLNTGPVVVGKIGDNLRMDYTAVGDTTNLAARLQQLAEPGTILVSEVTSRQVAGAVRLDALAPVQVKGKAEPVAPFKVLGPAPRRSPLEAREDRVLSRFVGREREVAALLDLLAQVEGGQGQVAGVVGEPGVGKSRLLYEFRHRLADRRLTYLEGRCLSYGSAIPYVPILDIVRSNCAIADADAPEAIAGKLRLALQEIGMDPDEGAPYLLRFLGVKEGTERLDVLTPEAIKTRTFETLRQMSLKGSRRRPLIFGVEDLHWIDTTSEEFLASLVESLPGAPILLLASYRPGYRPAWIEKSYSTQLALHPLSAPDSLSVVHSVARQEPLTDHLAQLILDKAEGNPFFLEELTRVAVEHGHPESGADVPDTIQAVLMARIDRLPDTPKRLLQTAAVLGREFSRPLLEAIWEGPGALDLPLRELRRLELVYERSGIDEPVYVFKHALTQEVAYAGLLTPRRQAFHAAAGRAIETLYADRLEQVYDRLAHHYSKTTEARKAVEYLARFAEGAARGHAHVEAVTALQEALVHVERLPAEDQDRRALDLVLRLSESLHYLGRRQETVDLLLSHEARIDRVHDPSVSGPLYFRLGFTYSFLGDREHAGQALMRAFAASMESHDEVTMGKASILGAFERLWSGRAAEAVEIAERAVTLLERTAERWWQGYAYFTLAASRSSHAEFEEALAAAARADGIAETIGDRRLQTTVAQVRGIILVMTAEWDAAIDTLRRGIERSPDAFETAGMLGFLGFAYLKRGDLAEAIPLLEQGVQQATQYRSRQIQAWYKSFLAEAYVSSGRLDAARGLADEALRLATETQALDNVAKARQVLGLIAQARSDFAEAEIHLSEALQIFTSNRSPRWVALMHLDLAALAQARGERDGAATHLREAYALFKTVRTPRWVERTEQLAQEFGLSLPAG